MNRLLIYGIVALAVVGIITATIVGIYHKGHEAGVAETTAAYAKRDNEALRKASEEIKRLEDEARKTEQRHADEQDTIAVQYEKELQDADAQKSRDIAAARAGRVRLSIPAVCPAGSGIRATGEAATSAGRRDGPARTDLPSDIAADLLALADDADQVVLQLTACQGIVRADRLP